MTDLSGAPQPENIDAEKDAWVDGGDWFDVVAATQSHEAVVVTRRHWLASLLRRDWASQIRANLQLPVIRIVDT